jgi:DNA polymerase elongation subunit (family B)
MQIEKLKVLIFDIETAPSLGWVWGKFDQDVISFENHWYMLSFAAKWLDSNKIMSYSLPDFPGYEKDMENDKNLVKKLWELLNEADVVIAHNGDKFDIRKSNARFLVHGFKPPSPYKTIDTLKIARKNFAFDSNRLDDLGKVLGLGEKVSTGGFKLWEQCMKGNEKAWNKMKKYNKQDVLLLEKVYKALRPWSKSHPRVTEESENVCHCCGSQNVQLRGFNYTKFNKFQRFMCKDCGSWTQGHPLKLQNK